MAPLIAAGKLNQRVTIEELVGTQDEAGQPVTTWVEFGTFWAQIAGDAGLRTIRSESEGVGAAINRYSFRLRYREGIDSAMRVSYAGRVFAIQSIRMDFAGRAWTDLVCEEIPRG